MGYVKDNFFEFPVKMYDIEDMISSRIQEIRLEEFPEDEHEQEPFLPHVAWATSIRRCKPEDILGWMESGDRGDKVEDLASKGFPRCIVTIKENFGVTTYESVWTKKKFEDRFDIFMETYKV